jgi:hypothetical protein
MKTFWRTLARWRTWLLNMIMVLALALPEIANAPEVLAVLPAEYQRWFLVAAFLVNIWLRPRPAVLKDDPEAQITRLKKAKIS